MIFSAYFPNHLHFYLTINKGHNSKYTRANIQSGLKIVIHLCLFSFFFVKKVYLYAIKKPLETPAAQTQMSSSYRKI